MPNRTYRVRVRVTEERLYRISTYGREGSATARRFAEQFARTGESPPWEREYAGHEVLSVEMEETNG